MQIRLYPHPSPPNSSSHTLSTVSKENFPISYSTCCWVGVSRFCDGSGRFSRNAAKCALMPSNALIAAFTSSHPPQSRGTTPNTTMCVSRGGEVLRVLGKGWQVTV